MSFGETLISYAQLSALEDFQPCKLTQKPFNPFDSSLMVPFRNFQLLLPVGCCILMVRPPMINWFHPSRPLTSPAPPPVLSMSWRRNNECRLTAERLVSGNTDEHNPLVGRPKCRYASREPICCSNHATIILAAKTSRLRANRRRNGPLAF